MVIYNQCKYLHAINISIQIKLKKKYLRNVFIFSLIILIIHYLFLFNNLYFNQIIQNSTQLTIINNYY